MIAAARALRKIPLFHTGKTKTPVFERQPRRVIEGRKWYEFGLNQGSHFNAPFRCR
jgi:hypothetical protein